MRRAILIFGVIVFIIVFGIPLWVFKGYSPDPAKELANGSMVKFLNTATGKITALPLEEYLAGVVAAEMPAEFAEEALKAQAVAARTYTVKRMFSYGGKPSDAHPGAEICNEPTHCQAWIDNGEMKNRWGKLHYFLYHSKIVRAVKDTRGQVITFNKGVIEPVYHSSCGGRGTENSEDVWSTAIPYLKGVDCKQEYKVREHVYVVKKDLPQLAAGLQALGMQSAAAAAAINQPALETLEKSARGRIIQARILGQVVSGKSLREALGVTSTLIEWQQSGSGVTIKSIGKGHAVGLCQFGANGMALAGSDYKAIILHYYTGVSIQRIK